MNNDLISREALKKAFNARMYYFNKLSWEEANSVIDNAPTVEPKLSDEQIEKITDLLETEWGYDGIRKDVSRILRGGSQ